MNEESIYDQELTIDEEEAIIKGIICLPYPAVSLSHRACTKGGVFHLNPLAYQAMGRPDYIRISIGQIHGEKYIILRASQSKNDYSATSASLNSVGISAVKTLAKLGMTCTNYSFGGRRAVRIKEGGIAIPVYETEAAS